MMEIGRGSRVAEIDTTTAGARPEVAGPGKTTLTGQLSASPGAGGAVQRKAAGEDNAEAGASPAGHAALRVGAHGDDVKQLQDKLNAVMNAGLTADGKFGPATLSAVRAFQAAHGLGADGVVGPMTWAALVGAPAGSVKPDHAPAAATVALAGAADHAAPSPGGPPAAQVPAPAAAAPVSGVRAAIVAAARSQVGLVQADVPGAVDETGKATRVGWERLMEYFTVAMGGSGPGKFIPSDVKYQAAGHHNKSGLVEWCGIFATWACKTGGAPLANWKLGVGVLSTLQITTDPQPGDIGYLDHARHHFIIVSVEGDTVVTIDGNSGSHSEVTENTKSRSKITHFYRVPA